jgi:hypothetical protein
MMLMMQMILITNMGCYRNEEEEWSPVNISSNEEREINGRRVMIGGAHMAVREGRGELGWVGSGAVWAGWLPGAAQVGCWFSPFIFFFLFSFSFVSDFCFGFLKKLYYSDLDKNQY